MATGDHLSSFDAVWDTVRNWPAAERRSLASNIMASLAENSAAATRSNASDLIAAWSDAARLDDASVQTVLEEELLRKHS